jgi:hypothetical protein
MSIFSDPKVARPRDRRCFSVFVYFSWWPLRRGQPLPACGRHVVMTVMKSLIVIGSGFQTRNMSWLGGRFF